MSKWAQIDNNKNRFRLLCNDSKCSLSVCNLLNGKLHISTIHSDNRHSITFSHEDMLFIVSQYLNSLSENDRHKMLNFFKTF